MGFNLFEKGCDGVGHNLKEKNPAVKKEVKPAVMPPPSSLGVKRINRVRGRRQSASIAMR